MEVLALTENAVAELVLTEITVNIKVINRFFLTSLDQISSRLFYYFIVFAILIAVIGGILFYIVKLRGNMKNAASGVDDDPNSIIGSDPEPKVAGRYGMQR